MFSKEVCTPSDVVVGLPRGFSVVNTSAIDADSGKVFSLNYARITLLLFSRKQRRGDVQHGNDSGFISPLTR